jgi:hypothetical protein
MAYTRRNYEDGTYDVYLNTSTFNGKYALEEPRFFRQAPLMDSVYIRTGEYGHVTRDFTNRVDAESEIKGYTRPSAREVVNQHTPRRNEVSVDSYTLQEFNVNETRLDNPGATLRGTGFNRWDWVHMNPQKNVMVPFDYLVDTKQVAKDNHRPCILKPEYHTRDERKMAGARTGHQQLYARGLTRF